MKRISIYLFATLLALGCFFTSCDNDEIVELSQEVAENESSAEQNEDDMFTVQFFNADGTPYEFSGETKGNWTGSKKSYRYRTTVVADWSDFKSDATDQVKFSGGDDKEKTLSSGSYTIAKNIAKDYTVSVTKKHKVTVSAGTGGSVSNSGSAYYDHGSSLKLTATPNSGYEFSKFVTNSGWEVTDNPKTYTVNSCFTVTAQFKAKAAAKPSIVIWAEFTDGYADDYVTTMRSFRVMYRVVGGPTTVAKKYEVYGYYDSSTNQCYSYGPMTVAAGSNATTNTQLWSSTAGFPAGITCGRMHIAVREL